MNERKTEKLVRDYLTRKGYFKNKKILVEEQKSDNPRITKLLKNASKKGAGAGYPEFIISSEEYPKLLIIVECKADPRKHISENRDKFSEYAVDGVLLYGSYLSKEYDVLAIAVSGEKASKENISHYLILENTTKPVEFFKNKILSFEEYFDEIIRSNYKFNQDYEKLVAYTKSLNETLHSKKIKESQRALLISGILIALKNDPFKTGYMLHTNVDSLVSDLYSTICSELVQSISPEKTDRLKASFLFIKSNTAINDLTSGMAFVKNLISDIDREINGFMMTHKYVDTVSQFYVEFLRYANDDKGLGIVLTPLHITDLFIELAEVDESSIVLDNCCGTGGFVISAMKKMIQLCNGDKIKEKNIKNKQLVGIEFQDDIYALLISNMIIHRDGRTNIILGDCFSHIANVKRKYKPNVGLLNPPYKTKKSDIEELDFVLNNLSALQRGSKCVALIPLSCVIEDTLIALNLKRKILAEHTLEAVMSMPEELFHNSDVNVVTCAIVITAHKPHPKGKKTWFGYWRNDGFIKVKGKGRIDKNHTWEATKKIWMDAYRNREEINMLSVTKEVTEKDEWCAEAYMETDYSQLKKIDFEGTVKKYLLYSMMDHNAIEDSEEVDSD